jgi:hypothetical protein
VTIGWTRASRLLTRVPWVGSTGIRSAGGRGRMTKHAALGVGTVGRHDADGEPEALFRSRWRTAERVISLSVALVAVALAVDLGVSGPLETPAQAPLGTSTEGSGVAADRIGAGASRPAAAPGRDDAAGGGWSAP